MSAIGQLLVELGINVAAFEEGLTKATYAAKKAGSEIQKTFTEMGESVRTAGIAFGALGPAGLAITEALSVAGSAAGKMMKEFAGVNRELGVFASIGAGAAAAAVSLSVAAIGLAVETAESAKHMREQAQIAGMNTTAFQQYAFAAKLAGVSQDTFASSMARLGAKIGSAAQGNRVAAQGFAQMGVAVKNADGTLRSMPDVLKDIADWSQKTADGAAKNALLTEVGSRGMKQLIPLLNQGAEGLKRAAEEAEQLGVVMSEKDIAAMDEFTQDMTRVKQAGQGLANQLTIDLMPAMRAFADQLVDSLKNPDSQLHKFIDGVAMLAHWFIDLVDIVGASMGEVGDFIQKMGAKAVIIFTAMKESVSSALHGDVGGAKKIWEDSIKAREELDKNFAKKTEERWTKVWQVIRGSEAPVPKAQPPEKPLKSFAGGVGANKPDEVEKMITALQREAKAALDLAGAVVTSEAQQAQARAKSKAEEEIGKMTDRLKQEKDVLVEKLGEMNKEKEKFTDAQRQQVEQRISQINKEQRELKQSTAVIIGLYEQRAASEAIAAAKSDTVKKSSAIDKEIADNKTLANSFGLEAESAAEAATALKDLSDKIMIAEEQAALYAAANSGDTEGIKKQAEAVAELRKQYSELIGKKTEAIEEKAVQSKESQLDIFKKFSKEYDTLAKVSEDTTTNELVRQAAEEQMRDLVSKTRLEYDKIAIDSGNMKEAMLGMLDKMAAEVPNLGKEFMADLSKALDQFNNALEDLITKGKINFKSLGQAIEKDFLSTALKGTEGVIAGLATGQGASGQGGKGGALGAIAGIFGVKQGDGKPDGSRNKPLYTRDADKTDTTDPLDAISKSQQDSSDDSSSLQDKLSGMFGSLKDVFSNIMQGITGALSGIGKFFGSLFGGGLATGGDVTPGKAYVVGEKHPEFFVPRQSGAIAPTLKTGNAQSTSLSVHFHGVTDMDSFKRSQTQIMGHVVNSMSRALDRR